MRGITDAHIIKVDGTNNDELCLHYDPNLVSIDQLKQLAWQTGAEITNRYRHEQIAFSRMSVADAAPNLTNALSKLGGMLHANVNYAAGLAYVAYDSKALTRETIEQAMRGMGVKVLPTQPVIHEDEDEDKRNHESHQHEHDAHEGHNHGTAPAFLPHWMQEKWELILIGLAGLFLLIGFVGETFFGMPKWLAVGLYILSYLTGGYDVALESIPPLLKLKFSTDVLMLFAAAGAAVLGIVQLPLAVFFHEGSTIVVVLNALRLLACREN